MLGQKANSALLRSALLYKRYEGVDTDLDTVELNRSFSTPRTSDYRDIVLGHASELDQGVLK